MSLEYFLDLLSHGNYKRELTLDRFLDPDKVYAELSLLSNDFEQEKIGYSVEGKPIKKIKWGKGVIKIMMWSQMHGNESTTTRALVNLLFHIDENQTAYQSLYEQLQLIIIPIVNPDGALNWTRYNANQVDLNRDALELSQPESQILMDCYKTTQPDICLNLHDQRSIFGVHDDFAGMSFLAPSFNEDQSLNHNRTISMQIVAHINDVLSKNGLKAKIGRYDEAFNKNCFGDYFQCQDTPCILFEAGQLQLDYNRDFSVYYTMLSLYVFLHSVVTNEFKKYGIKDYYKIPMNKKVFTDLLIKNVSLNDGVFHIGIMYDMRVHNHHKAYNLVIRYIQTEVLAAHRIIDANGNHLRNSNNHIIKNLSIGEYLSDISVHSVNYSIY